MRDGPQLHILCAVAASANAAVLGSPLDVIKTRTMMSPDPSNVNYIEMVRGILVKEGPRSFFKGLDALFFRLSIWNSLMFVVLEQIKLYFYDPSLDL